MSLSDDDFNEACREWDAAWQSLKATAVGRTTNGWEDVNILERYGVIYLRITRKLQAEAHSLPRVNGSGPDEETPMDEDDHETLEGPTGRKDDVPMVIYDVVHSPSYHVPVLYLRVTSNSHRTAPPSLLEVYELLVPAAQHPQMRSVGVMGALSVTDHPISGVPSWFVHPCRTAEAMGSLLEVGDGDGDGRNPGEYLLMWLGLVGANVGLHVPVDLAEAMADRHA